jgi:thiamine pyrophosphokinase
MFHNRNCTTYKHKQQRAAKRTCIKETQTEQTKKAIIIIIIGIIGGVSDHTGGFVFLLFDDRKHWLKLLQLQCLQYLPFRTSYKHGKPV